MPDARTDPLSLLFSIAGWAVAGLAGAAVVWDIVQPDVGGGTAAAQAGFRVGSVIGTVIRTLVLGVVALLLIARGKRGPAAPIEHQIPAILAAHAGRIPAAPSPDIELYAKAPTEELIGALERMDRERYPERFAALLWVLSQRAPRTP